MRISACMIVKNEEENIGRCIRSIKDAVDEIIVVDTGSTDQTVAKKRPADEALRILKSVYHVNNMDDITYIAKHL